jgi:hypothetical protein
MGGNTTLALCAHQAPFPACGMVFALTPPPAGKTSWTESVIHTFTGVNGDGSDPQLSGVVLDDCGNLYGTTNGGGKFGWYRVPADEANLWSSRLDRDRTACI